MKRFSILIAMIIVVFSSSALSVELKIGKRGFKGSEIYRLKPPIQHGKGNYLLLQNQHKKLLPRINIAMRSIREDRTYKRMIRKLTKTN